MTSNDCRCVVTGLGVICAVGNNVEETWKNALASVSGIHRTTSVDTEKCYADLAAEVHCDTLDDIDFPEEKDRASKLCIKAASEALRDARLESFADDSRVSVIIGSCVGGVLSVEHYHQHGRNPLDIPKMPIAAIASQVAETCKAGGIVTNVANACAAGTISIALACDAYPGEKGGRRDCGRCGFLRIRPLLRLPFAPRARRKRMLALQPLQRNNPRRRRESSSWNPSSTRKAAARKSIAKFSDRASRAMRTTSPHRAKTRSVSSKR